MDVAAIAPTAVPSNEIIYKFFLDDIVCINLVQQQRVVLSFRIVEGIEVNAQNLIRWRPIGLAGGDKPIHSPCIEFGKNEC